MAGAKKHNTPKNVKGAAPKKKSSKKNPIDALKRRKKALKDAMG